MELKGEVNGVKIYDDFCASSATAIETTLGGLRAHVGNARIIAVLEPRSYTMRSGYHKDTLADSLHAADIVFMQQPHDSDWDLNDVISRVATKLAVVFKKVTEIVDAILKEGLPR